VGPHGRADRAGRPVDVAHEFGERVAERQPGASALLGCQHVLDQRLPMQDALLLALEGVGCAIGDDGSGTTAGRDPLFGRLGRFDAVFVDRRGRSTSRRRAWTFVSHHVLAAARSS